MLTIRLWAYERFKSCSLKFNSQYSIRTRVVRRTLFAPSLRALDVIYCFIIASIHRETKWKHKDEGRVLLFGFEVFGTYDETRCTSLWSGFSNSTTFPWDVNNTNVGCCLKFLFERQWVDSRLSERWQRLSKKSPKAVFVARSTVGKGSSVTDQAVSKQKLDTKHV